MANLDHWNNWKTKEEMWELLIGRRQPDEEGTCIEAEKIFRGLMGDICLEIGAGNGRMLHQARRRYMIAVGVDWSWRMINAQQRDWPTTVLVHNDGLLLPFGDGVFDLVYSFTCFQHMESLEMIVSNLVEAYRVLRAGGDFVMQTVRGENGTGRHDGYVFRSTAELSALLVNWFQDVSVELSGEWLWARAKR